VCCTAHGGCIDDGFPMRAEDYGMIGDDIPQCFICANEPLYKLAQNKGVVE